MSKISIIIKKENREKIAEILKTLGLSDRVDFCTYGDENITDGGINFKLNHKGSSVPIWTKAKNEEEIYNYLLAISVAIDSGMNPVEISEKLKTM